jgi:hypothetical protein
MQALAEATVAVADLVSPAAAGAALDRYTPHDAGVVPVDVWSQISVIAGFVSAVDHVDCA